VDEASMRVALAAIGQLEAVLEAPAMIRIVDL
jgi:hypothetical protein